MPQVREQIREVLDAANRKRGKSWSAKSFSVGKSGK